MDKSFPKTQNSRRKNKISKKLSVILITRAAVVGYERTPPSIVAWRMQCFRLGDRVKSQLTFLSCWPRDKELGDLLNSNVLS